MRRSTICVFAGVAAAAGLGVSGAAMPVSGSRSAQTAKAPVSAVSLPAGAPGTLLWVRRYTTAGKGFDASRSVAVSPSGDKVFVTGYSESRHTSVLKYVDYATVAYEVATGARLWVSRYNGPANGADEAQSVAVSPSGRTVFVTGYSVGATSEQDYATIAYDSATGAQLWVKRYNGTGNSYDAASSVAVSHNGHTVFVTGLSAGASSGFDYATVAYNAVTGTQRWVSRYNGPGNGYDEAHSIAASRDGSRVFVTGYSEGPQSGSDYATLAYNAVTGAQVWVRRYNGPGNDYDEAWQLAVSPNGRRLFVTGTSGGEASLDYATVAYNAATGGQLWVRRYDGPGQNLDVSWSVAVSHDGRQVFTTGASVGSGSSVDYATIAYRARTGSRLWVKRYNGPGNGIDAARSVGVSPNGRTVYVTGGSDGVRSGRDYATVAYNAATGSRLWVKRYDGPGNNWDFAYSLAIGPRARMIVVTGESVGRITHFDYATVAYRG
jgi:hypothetical protein